MKAQLHLLLLVIALGCCALRLGDTTSQPMPYHVIIAGSRDFNNYELLRERCDTMLANKPDAVVISGGARGADRLGERYAKERGLGLVLMPADWNTYGKRAGYVRNVAMAKQADAVIAFWDGESLGTEHMIQIACERRLPLRIVRTPKA